MRSPRMSPSHQDGEQGKPSDRDHLGALRGQLARWEATAAQMAARLPPAWRRRRRWTIVGLVACGVLVIYFLTRLTSPAGPQQVAPDTKVFQTSNTPVLRFAHSSGEVHISSGKDGQVRIRELRNGVTSAIQTQYAQKGDAITVTVSIPDGLYLDTWVDFDVAVPQRTGVTAQVARGTLVATNLDGNVTLRNTNGAIEATNLNGATDVTTQSGAITLTRVQGQVTATTQNGTITTSETRLSGHSTVRAQSGTINFHGSLDPRGSTLFSDSNGAIGLTLPRGSAVAVDARATSGSIASAFPTVPAVQQQGGSMARGRIGREPLAHLTVQTTTGSIQLLDGR